MVIEQMDINIIDTTKYDKAINEIGLTIDKYKLNYIEAYGVLQGVKNELNRMYNEEEE